MQVILTVITIAILIPLISYGDMRGSLSTKYSEDYGSIQVEFNITSIKGLRPVAEGKSYVDPDDVVTVSGKMIQHLKDGSMKTAVFSDIILSNDRNVYSSWLVSYDLDFGRSNLAKLKTRLKQPLRLGDPAGKLKPGVSVSLFSIERIRVSLVDQGRQRTVGVVRLQHVP